MVRYLSTIIVLMALSSMGYAFDLSSSDIKANRTIGNEFIFQGMGCNGKNLSPELHWKDAPKGTKSFALTVYDPDAPTGSGWWHWIVVDIPSNVTSLSRAWKAAGYGKEITSDFGASSYGGPCPPPGKPHRYIFTAHALSTEKIDAPDGSTNAYVRFLIEAASIKQATFTAKYGRK